MPYPTDGEWLARARGAANSRSDDAGEVGNIDLLPRHASMRRYARVVLGGRPEILMMMPAPGAGPDEAGGGSSTALGEDPFVLAQGWLSSLGLPVPALYAVDEAADCLWLEDVGATDLETWIRSGSEPIGKVYERVLAMLGQFQLKTQDSAPPAFVSGRVFDASVLKWELEHYVEWRVEAALGRTITPNQATALGSAFDRLVSELAQIPLVPMHRDFQSHNIMVRDDRSLVMLDFQDAMLGPAVYDAVALLRDSYVEIPHGVLTGLVRHYAESITGSPALIGASIGDVERWFHMQTLQRKLKDAGRFVFIDRVKGNPDFLQYVDGSCRYVQEAFTALGDEFDDLASLLSDIDPDVTP